VNEATIDDIDEDKVYDHDLDERRVSVIFILVIMLSE
jgi:hypothetical protein